MILFINSPGGTTTGGEALFEAIRELAKVKPVVGQMGTVAASAAYIAGLATDHIVARGNTITGSVGVIFQWAEVSQLHGQARRQDERDQERAPEGQPVAVPARRRGGQGGGRADGGRVAALVRGPGRRAAAASTRPSVAGLEQGRVYSGREALATSSWTRSAARPRRSNTWRRSATSPRACKVVDFKPKRDSDWGLMCLSRQALARLIGERAGGAIGRLLDATTRSADCALTAWYRFGRVRKDEPIQRLWLVVGGWEAKP